MGSYVSHSAAPSPPPRPPPHPHPVVEESRIRDLPLELLISIIGCLPLVDRVRFGCVCSAFRGALQYCNLSSSCRPPPRSLPWLLLPDESTAAANAFFSVSDRRTYRIPQPAAAVENRTWLGSSDGWLVVLDRSSSQLLYYLLNPITRSQIHLPPLAASSPAAADRCLEFSKAVVSWKMLLSGKVYTVVLLSAKRLVCVGSRDRTWTSFGTRDAKYLDAAICNSCLYTMKSNGKVEAWDLAATDRPDLAMTIIMPDLVGGFASFTKYLVGSDDIDGGGGGGVLQVWRSREFSQVAFKIFRLDLDKGEWVEKKSLDGRVLFLNSCCSMSLTYSSEDDYSDCIFFDRLTSEKKRESMVFRLKDGSVARVLLHGSCWNPSPIWIAPSQAT